MYKLIRQKGIFRWVLKIATKTQIAGVFPNTLIPTVSTWIQQVSNEHKIPSLYCLYFLCIVYFVLKVLRFESTFRTES